MRSIGMDVHRTFAQIAVVEDGLCRDEGRIGVRPEDLRKWTATLDPGDEVAPTNSDAIATLLRPLVAKVVVSNPRKTRAIAEVKVKTDKVDARILAQLLAADFLPGTWVADDRTRKAAPVGDAPHASGEATHPSEEPGARDPGAESRSDVSAR